MMTSPTAAPVLKVDGIDAFYDASQVLFGLSLSLHKGETLALLGRNGAGKSTTMKSIAGIVRGRKGSVRLAGVEIRGQAPHQIARAGIAFVPEDRQIFPALDGLAITWFDSTESMKQGAMTPVYAETRADEANFLPDGHLPFIITMEHEIVALAHTQTER